MRKRNTYSNEYKVSLLKEWQRSGTKSKDFAVMHGVHPNMFYKWRKQFLEQKGNAFVEITNTICSGERKINSSPSELFKIRTGNFELEVPLTACEHSLQTLFKVLGSL